MIRKYVFTLLLTFVFTGCAEESLVLMSGEKVTVEDYKGSWLVINYWAVWCAPCREEIPELNQLDQHPRYKVLGVNYDAMTGFALDDLDQARSLRQQIKVMGIDFEQLAINPAHLFDAKLPASLPLTLVVDPQGQLFKVISGKVSQRELIALTAGNA